MRVVVLGAGYAGLLVTRALEDALPDSVSLTVVDEHDYHLVQHELHRVVRRPGFADEISVPLDDLFERANVRQARVEAVEPDERTVTLEDGEALSYDVAAVCLGATTDFAGLPGVEEHATPLKRVEDALAIREGFLAVLDDATEQADGPEATDPEPADTPEPADPGPDDAPETTDAPESVDTPESADDAGPADAPDQTDHTEPAGPAGPAGRPTAVVGGAGLSGIQVAGELAALAREEGAGDSVRVLLLEQESTVAPGFRSNFRSAVRDELERRGVEVRTGVTVERATDSAIHVAGGDPVPYDQFVWTGGIQGTGALRGERPVVRSTLALDDHTFVVGDAARVVDAEGEPVPASAQAAVREARTAATNVTRVVESELAGDPIRPRLDRFVFDSRGWLVSVGDGAVAQVGPAVFRGRAANALKSSVGMGYLATAGSIRDAVDVVREEFRGRDG